MTTPVTTMPPLPGVLPRQVGTAPSAPSLAPASLGTEAPAPRPSATATAADARPAPHPLLAALFETAGVQARRAAQRVADLQAAHALQARNAHD